MAAAVPYLIGASTVIGAHGAIEQGEAAKAASRFKAKTAMATGTRKASEQKRAGDIVLSGARAAMAAGGGSASDPGAIETLGKIEAEKDYNVLSALYEGKTGRDISIYEGDIAQQAASAQALSTILSGSAGMYRAYNRPVT